jgi:hypothetical protein
MLYSSHFRVTGIALWIYHGGLGDFWRNCVTFITVTFISRLIGGVCGFLVISLSVLCTYRYVCNIFGLK